MKHRINGIPINLRELTEYELDALVRMSATRIAAAQDDLDKLRGEQLRHTRQMASINEY